jgi:L-ascorbate metabolism protein UlaG (beta-lactamase superfamily)
MALTEAYRLADSTVAEPLINNWAVWSDTVSPMTYSLHLMNYQLKTLSSYLDDPQLHLKACRNPKLIGGPFVDVPAERASEVESLLRRTEGSQSENIKLAKSITEFYDFLSKEAKGQSLDPYYEKIPEVLQGYVELLYDYYHHPIVRLLETLLYESPYYRWELQSIRIFEQKSDHSRPFFLSTPRLLNREEIDWNIPFADPRLDELFKLSAAPQPLRFIGDTLGFDDSQLERLKPLLSYQPVARADQYEGPGVRLRYFGHACVLIEWQGVSVLTDPWLGVRSAQGGSDRFSYDDLPERIDFALITHGHHDHFVPETLLRLRHKIACLVVPRTFGLFYTDPSLKLLAQKIGFKQIVELDALESIPVSGGEIISAPFLGEHADLPHGKCGYIVRAGKAGILFAADSNCLDKRVYEHMRKVVGSIETVFLGMECVGAPLSWLYGALVPAKLQHSLDQTRRTKGSNSRAALELLDAVGAKRVYVYAMGNEPWLEYGMGLGLPEGSAQMKEANKLLAIARTKGFIEAQRPFCKFEIHL